MKKIFFGALLLSAGTLSAQAQISAGSKLVNGSIGYRQYKSETNSSNINGLPLELKSKEFNFNTNAGYFIADNLALGVQGSVSMASYNSFSYSDTGMGTIQTDIIENNGHRLTGGFFGRYYKFIADKVALYGQLGGGYQNIYSKNGIHIDVSAPTSNRQQGYYANLLPGIVFFPTDKLGLELTLRGASYNHLTVKKDIGSRSVKNTNSNLDFGFGLNDLNLGISLYLDRN